MKEYVTVPDQLLQNTAELKPYLYLIEELLSVGTKEENAPSSMLVPSPYWCHFQYVSSISIPEVYCAVILPGTISYEVFSRWRSDPASPVPNRDPLSSSALVRARPRPIIRLSLS